MRRTLALIASSVLLAGTAATACGATPASSAGPTPSPKITKVVVFMVENHSLSEMKSGMPRTYRFASRYGVATHYRAITHPSLPNYLAIAAGSTKGVTDDASPSSHQLTGPTIFSQALAAHKTAKTYADAMPGTCDRSDTGEYAVRHNPWTYFTDDTAACHKYDVPATRLAHDVRAGQLPNLSFVVPDVIHDAHDGTLAQADAWISGQIKLLTSGSDWRSGHLAIVVTADEDDHSASNTVLTTVASRYQRHKVVTSPLTHYSLTGFIDDVLHVSRLGNAATAPSMARAFGVRL